MSMKSDLSKETLELAAQAETILNLYITAKRELNMHLGFVADVTSFPAVQSLKEQIKTVRIIAKN